MRFSEAVERMKIGKKITREGRVFQLLDRGVWDVTDDAEKVRTSFTEDERAAIDWEEA